MSAGKVALVSAFVAPVLANDLQGSSASASQANPIRKVVNLLTKMQNQVQQEGEKSKQLHEEYMCYCKSAGGDIKASMTAANNKVPAVGTSIKEAEAQLDQAKSDLKSDQVSRSEAKRAMEEATSIRQKEASAFAEVKAMHDTNIAAIKKAVASLTKGMAGGFLQTSAAQVVRKLALDRADMLDSDRQMLLSFLSGTHDSGYSPSSGEVTGILKELGETMAKTLADLTDKEDSAISNYSGLMAAKKKEVDTLSSSIEANTAKIGDLGVSIVQMKNDLSETEAGLLEDQQFLADMEKNCATKEAEWDEAVRLRGEELVAIAETIKVLNDDDALDLFKKTLPGASSSFIQTGNAATLRARALASVQKAQHFDTASRPQFDLIALAIRGKAAGFEKVVALIDTMVQTLKKEQDDDAHKKEYCEGQLDVADDKKKSLERSVSDLEKAIATAIDGVATIKDEIVALEDGIKALDKAVKEANEQRKDESEEYTDLMASDTAAKELLKFAKNRLNKFYNPTLYKAPAKVELSREGRIEASMSGTEPPTEAPGGIAGTGIAVFAQVRAHVQRKDRPSAPEGAAAYGKKSEESTGVITLIDMLIADLDKEMTQRTTTEKDSQSEYEVLMKHAAQKRIQDVKALAERSSTQAGLESDIEANKEQKISDTKGLMATLEYIASLHQECDWLLQNFDVRREARAGEIEALGQAKAVLNGADYSLVQTKSNGFMHRRL